MNKFPNSAKFAAVSGSEAPPILIIKYCIGGTNIYEHANPVSPKNIWDRCEDTGKADWLLNSGAVNLSSNTTKDRDHSYANLLYTIRRTTEIMDNASIPYRFEGLFWIQGGADKFRDWNEYGVDLRRYFETLRSDIGV